MILAPHRRATRLEGTPKMFCEAKIFGEESGAGPVERTLL